MKGKKYKRSQRFIQNIYENYFGIRRPYQVIPDAKFCIEALNLKISTSEAMTEVFGGPVKLMTTPCVQTELKRHDARHSTGTVFVARRFELRQCRHETGAKTGSECLKELVGPNNPHHYCIAAQDQELRKELRDIAGTPLVFILRDTVVLEPPSEKTLKMAKSRENAKLKTTLKLDLPAIKKATEKILNRTDQSSVEEPHSATSLKNKKLQLKQKQKKKRSGPKNPNPLSCKKPKKKCELPLSKPAAASVTKKRKRRSKKTKTGNDSNAKSSEISAPVNQ